MTGRLRKRGGKKYSMAIHAVMRRIGESAKEAARTLALASTAAKNKVLRDAAASLRRRNNEILSENAKDMAAAEKKGLTAAMLDRLRQERERIKAENEKALEEFELRKQEREAEDEATRKKAEEEERALAEIDAIDKKKKDLERLQEAIRFYDRFPEGSVEDQQAGKAWGSERLKLIQMKQNGRLILSPEEIEFLSNLDLWAMGKRYREEEKKKEEGEKP